MIRTYSPQNNRLRHCSTHSSASNSEIFYSYTFFLKENSCEYHPPWQQSWHLLWLIRIQVRFCSWCKHSHPHIPFPVRSIHSTFWGRRSFCKYNRFCVFWQIGLQFSDVRFFPQGNPTAIDWENVEAKHFRRKGCWESHWWCWLVWGCGSFTVAVRGRAG